MSKTVQYKLSRRFAWKACITNFALTYIIFMAKYLSYLYPKCGYIWILLCLLSVQCEEQNGHYIYKYIHPDYNSLKLWPAHDTIEFKLEKETYNEIKSFNYFISKGKEFISFYDRVSESINIYDFSSFQLVKKILIKECLPGQSLNKTSVFVKNFDTILISNYLTLNYVDSTKSIKKSITLPKKPFLTFVSLKNSAPPVFQDNILYTLTRPHLPSEKLSNLKKWRVLYKFDSKVENGKTYYKLPKTYLSNVFGYHFLNSSYCINSSGQFVFSFPADTNIYESNIAEYSTCYLGKSKYQIGSITPLNSLGFNEDGINEKSFYLNDSYGSIYYDTYHKRYLRVAQRKLSKQDFFQRRWKKEQSIIIFDEKFKIIGESLIDKNCDLSSVFFTSKGNIYVRTDLKNEKTIQFVRLYYNERSEETKLTKLYK